ncbi:uncharacterized protein YehS (DUF1456 family) [Neobacillus niacini]|uniref:DUF1456 family protein n=1 Tax=Neobacillus niacini TaxID=86668 RepID=UPI00105235ED|nr:DUF1456 family protein [Neobacillus niacini]MDR7078459.1 uncharacterized protein YehS (DUF1456 family) [Neobacillus niacini]
MDNNDILVRLRYALDIKDTDMVKIFKLGDVEVTKDDVLKILTKPTDSYDDEEDYDDNIEENDDYIKCNNRMLDSFLNGFITFKRGKQEPKPGQPDAPAVAVKKNGNINNIVLKKVKIALELTSEDMLELFEKAGVTITKGELSALLRKEGHKNYKECLDKYARNFLKGLAIKYRG